MDELVIKAINGDEDAFTELIIIYKDDLYRIASIRLKDMDDVYDAVQETLVTVYKSIKKLKEPKYFKTWLIKILINKCNWIYKRKKREINLLEKIKINNKKNLEFDFSNSENLILIEKYFEKLSYNEKICLVMFYGNNYTLKEMSKILKISENTIKSRITRAKNKIKKDFKGGGEDE